MKFGILVYPGSNCDDDMVYLLQDLLGLEGKKIWHKSNDLGDLTKNDLLVIPGGFSYGDYLRAGAIARFSKVMSAVTEFAKNGGLIIGICNGFQILCESGLLPGTLLRNNNQKYISRWVHIRVMTTNTPMTASLEKDSFFRMPIAHAEGRYYADEKTVEHLAAEDRVVFKYCDDNGNITDLTNPNGSVSNIAGICNEGRNVIGMMPHPERAAEDILGSSDGRLLFESLVSSAQVTT